MLDRMIRAAKLDAEVYDEIRDDTSLTSQALTVVVVVALANALGSLIHPRLGIGLFLGELVAFFVWSFVAHLVAVSVLGGSGDYSRVIRTAGYAYAPSVLGLLAIIPCIGWLAALAGSLWTLVAEVVAVREATGVETGQAVVAAAAGWVVALLVSGAILAVFVGLG